MRGRVLSFIEQRKNTSPFSKCPKSHGELERVAALSNNNRARRRVRRAREDVCGGKSHFPEQTSLHCNFCARKSERFRQKLVGVAVAGGACSLVHHFYLCKHPLQLVKLFAGYERVVIGALQLDYVCPAAVGGHVVYVVQVYYVGLVAAEEGGRV